MEVKYYFQLFSHSPVIRYGRQVYNSHLIWGGEEDCAHEFSGEDISCVREETLAGKSRTTERFYRDESRRFNGNHQKHYSTRTCIRCGAWRGAFGLEPTVEMYIEHTVEILREIRRVLRKDGVVFWNVGDSYAAYRDSKQVPDSLRNGDDTATTFSGHRNPEGLQASGLKHKDLCLIPSRVALAAQADGWWVRSMIIWAKPNPMPESVADRPTDAYEQIIMFTKSANYFWDAEAVKERSVEPERERNDRFNGNRSMQHSDGGMFVGSATRNLRNVWQFPTQPFAGAHFATFPEELPRRCIKAATSERGACAKCGAPWQRILEVHELDGKPRNYSTKYDKYSQADGAARMALRRETLRSATGNHADYFPEKRTVGWEPTCKCGVMETMPCLVLDPFGGSGTTGRVAVELNRRCMLLDLAYAGAYAPLAEARTRHVQRNLVAM